MKEVLKHPFVIAAITFFIVFVWTISVLTGIGREKVTIDTSAWQIIETTSSDVDDILDNN